MNATPDPIPQCLVAAESDFPLRAVRRCFLALTPLVLLGSVLAEDRKPAEGAPRAERPAGPERIPGVGGRRAEFPEELKLTEDQQAQLKEINAEMAAKEAELAKKRETMLTEEQRTARAEVAKKIREGELTRQDAADQLAAALKLTSDQQKQMVELDVARRSLAQEANTRKTAVLTEEQRGTLRKLTIAAGVARTFSIPGGIEPSDAQKASLKALQEELGPKLTDLMEKQASLLTDERRVARDAAFKEARENGKDRESTAQAIDAALKMTDVEKAQLTETEQALRQLHEQIRDKIIALLTPEQKAEFEKRAGPRR
jgi:Spy/CpxP family protein refolding chaperone